MKLEHHCQHTVICLLIAHVFVVSTDSNSQSNNFGDTHGNTRPLPHSPKIAIVGAGVGGSAVAYFLKDLGQGSASVDVYEKTSVIGGRLHTVKVQGKYYETGGSIIHPRNKYAKTLVKKLKLRKLEKESGSGFALVRNREVVFTTGSWNVVTIMKILWRYGLGFNHLMTFTDQLIDKFSRIYALQESKITFQNPRELLTAMSPLLTNLTQTTFRRYLESISMKEVLIDELVQAITYVNYGQGVLVHGLVGTIAVAGADDGLWSIENGNKQLPRALLTASGATLLLNTEIKAVINSSNGTYVLRTAANTTKAYDIVIIANPLEVSQVQFINFTRKPYDVNKRKYHRTVATIVVGSVRKNFTMATEEVNSVFTCDASEFFTSIGRIYPTDAASEQSESSHAHEDSAGNGGEPSVEYPVYKIFSPLPLTEKQLDIVFDQVADVQVFDWRAYPEYDHIPQVFPSFVLDDDQRLYYLNSIEWAASAIEMSLISAKNIALLVSQRVKPSQFSDSATIDRIKSEEHQRKMEL